MWTEEIGALEQFREGDGAGLQQFFDLGADAPRLGSLGEGLLTLLV